MCAWALLIRLFSCYLWSEHQQSMIFFPHDECVSFSGEKCNKLVITSHVDKMLSSTWMGEYFWNILCNSIKVSKNKKYGFSDKSVTALSVRILFFSEFFQEMWLVTLRVISELNNYFYVFSMIPLCIFWKLHELKW